MLHKVVVGRDELRGLLYFLLFDLQCCHPVRSRMIGAGVEKINFLRKLRGKGHSIVLFLLFKAEVSGVSSLKDREKVSQTSLYYIQGSLPWGQLPLCPHPLEAGGARIALHTEFFHCS